nr:Ig-like domain-containing protein [Paenibacillus shirakamiensis]
MVLNVLLSVSVGAVAGANGPSITSNIPTADAKGIVADNVQLQLDFDNPVKLGNGTIRFTKIDASGQVMPASPVEIQVATSPALDYRRTFIFNAVSLEEQTKYRVIVPSGTFTDENNVDSALKEWEFTTKAAASKAPEISTIVPNPNSVLTSYGTTPFSITFDKKVTKGQNGSIYVKKFSNNASITIPLSSISVSSSNTVSFDVSGLEQGESYYVLIDAGIVQDEDNQAFSGFSTTSVWNFSVAGAALPSLSNPALTPSNSANNVAVGSSLKLTFNRPVYPNSGAISIQQGTSSQSSIPVTSAAVTGGGTREITITPTTAFTAGAQYTVNVPANAFRDSGGTMSSAISNWTFSTMSASSTPLTVVSKSPTDQSGSVSIATTPIVTFNRNIVLSSGNNQAANGTEGITLRKAGTTILPSAVIRANGTSLSITPSSPLDLGATYYVDITAGAIKDTNGIGFNGLSGAASWSFATGAADTTSPIIQTSQLYNNTTIRLQYNETLDNTNNILNSTFSVLVNGENRQVSSTYISGDSVYVVLETGVAVGQNVRISYTANSLRPIQDLYRNVAASFSAREVSNGIDSALPKPQDGYVSGSTLILTFKDSLKSVSTYAASQFTVTSDGYSKSVSSISQSGNTVYLYLSSSVGDGEVVKVSYNPSSYPIQDYRGQNISAFSDFFVRNTYDTKAPLFSSAVGSGNKVVLTYNEALKTTALPMKNQFSILVNNMPVYVTALGITGNQVTLTLASSYTQDQKVTVSYVPSSGGISDLNGNLAGYINLENVSFSSTAGQVIRTATVKGDTVTLNFNGTLRYAQGSIPYNLFYVNADNQNKGVVSATLEGSTITLKLSSPVTSSQIVDVSYMQGTTPIYDTQGNPIAGFSRLAVQNIADGSSGTSGLPSYLSLLSTTDFGKSSYLLSVNTASKTTDRSRYGQSINKYTLDSAKITEAYNYLATSAQDRTLGFEVPSAEKAAEVAVPLQSLLDAYNRGGNPSFVVRHGDTLYEIPLGKISYTDMARLLGVSTFSSSYLIVQLERVPSSSMSTTISAIGASSVGVEEPVDIYISATSATSQGTQAVTLSGKLMVRTSKSVPSTQTSLIKYQINAHTGSFLPSKMGRSGNYTIFTSLTMGNLIAGPATGITFFSDIGSHWARNDMIELATKMIIEGRSQYAYQPNQNMTRAEFAVAIARGLGLTPESTSVSRFRDVPTASSAMGYIGAAAKAGIITGNTDGTFQPSHPITREQMAIMMVRALNAVGSPITLNTTPAQTLKGFKDGKKITSQDLVAKAYQEGIIQGTSTTTFDPKGNATRAQAAVMLKRVLSKLGYL